MKTSVVSLKVNFEEVTLTHELSFPIEEDDIPTELVATQVEALLRAVLIALKAHDFD